MSWLLREVEREQHREVKATVCRSEMSEHAISRGSTCLGSRQTAAEDESSILTRPRCLQPTRPLPTGPWLLSQQGDPNPSGGLTVPATHTGNGFSGRAALPPSSWRRLRLHCSANTAAPQRCPQDTHTQRRKGLSPALSPALLSPAASGFLGRETGLCKMGPQRWICESVPLRDKPAPAP